MIGTKETSKSMKQIENWNYKLRLLVASCESVIKLLGG